MWYTYAGSQNGNRIANNQTAAEVYTHRISMYKMTVASSEGQLMSQSTKNSILDTFVYCKQMSQLRKLFNSLLSRGARCCTRVMPQ